MKSKITCSLLLTLSIAITVNYFRCNVESNDELFSGCDLVVRVRADSQGLIILTIIEPGKKEVSINTKASIYQKFSIRILSHNSFAFLSSDIGHFLYQKDNEIWEEKNIYLLESQDKKYTLLLLEPASSDNLYELVVILNEKREAIKRMSICLPKTHGVHDAIEWMSNDCIRINTNPIQIIQL